MAEIQNLVDTKFTEAMKAKDTAATAVLRLLKSALANERIAKMHDLTSDEEIQVVRREVKKREDSIALYRQGGAEDKAKVEEGESAYLKQFLPPEMSDDNLKAVVQKVIAANPGEQNFGKLMGQVMKEVSGKVSGDRVSAVVKSELNK